MGENHPAEDGARGVIAGEGSSIYKVRGERLPSGSHRVGDFPPPFPPLDKFEADVGGKGNLPSDVADPDS